MLQIDRITLQFNEKPLFTDFSLRVQAGEMVCVTGRSGCGKSSLLRAVMGFVPLKDGSVTWNDTTLSARTVDRLRRSMAYLPQELSFPYEWVREMVQLPFRLRVNAKKPFEHARLMEYFRRLGLDEALYEARVNEVSGGQRQRMMLAVEALLGKELFLVDEPTSALDAGSAHQVLSFFNELQEQRCTLLVVTHDTQFAAGSSRTVPIINADEHGND